MRIKQLFPQSMAYGADTSTKCHWEVHVPFCRFSSFLINKKKSNHWKLVDNDWFGRTKERECSFLSSAKEGNTTHKQAYRTHWRREEYRKKKMHPPLDRPHPDCQEEIQNLRECHATKSTFNFSACNEIKFRLDKCFRAEKERILKEMNQNLEGLRREEDQQAAMATGKNMSFQEYLATDKAYHKDMKEIEKNQSSKGWFGL